MALDGTVVVGICGMLSVLQHHVRQGAFYMVCVWCVRPGVWSNRLLLFGFRLERLVQRWLEKTRREIASAVCAKFSAFCEEDSCSRSSFALRYLYFVSDRPDASRKFKLTCFFCGKAAFAGAMVVFGFDGTATAVVCL